MHAEQVFDTSTTCRHGHFDGDPLCPPRWGDTGEEAGVKHCDTCRRLLPEDYKGFNAFDNCEDCITRMRRSESGHIEYVLDMFEEHPEFFCQTCEDDGENPYHEEEICESCQEYYGDRAPKLIPTFQCRYCKLYYNDDMQAAIDCCTKITPWEFPD
jgi:hypothetical protein